MKASGFAAIVVLLWLTGCQETQEASKEIDFGTIKNSVYRNEYFGMTLTVPDNWYVMDEEGRKQVMEVGAEMVAGDDETLKSAIKASELTTVNLLSIMEHPPGTPVPFNPNLGCLAERVRDTPGIKTGDDYFFHVKRLLESSQIAVTFSDSVTEVVGGREFRVMPLEMSAMGQTVHQKFYACIDKGYALVFVASYSTDEELAKLQKVFDTVKFNEAGSAN